MAKILTELEIIDIIARAPEEIDDARQYERFVEALARAVTDQFGGALGTVEYVGPEHFDPARQKLRAYTPKSAPRVSVAVHHDDSVPGGGGIWKGYDPAGDE